MPYELHPIGTRHTLRETFDQVAELYDSARPSYPEAAFNDVVDVTGVTTASRILEIGCGTGHATQVFAERGFRIQCVELGEKMAAIAQQRLAAFPNIEIDVADFDTWTTTDRFDLAYSATAYHWLNPATREQHIASLLSQRGWLAIWRNRHVRNGSSDDFLDDAQKIYFAEAPEIAQRRGLLPHPDQVFDTELDELSRNYFDEPVLRRYLWSRAYTASEYTQMLNTHSDHQLLAPERRDRLFQCLTTLINARYNGSITKDYATILQMARKRT
jgi:SAM-dependent methyltransferase